MKYLELSYSSFGSLMGGNYNGKFADLNQISQIIFDIIQESETPPEFFRFHTPQNFSSPETIKNFLANFSETYLRDLREILIYKRVNLIVKGDSYKYNLREDKMTQEQLRMQMLAGIITESQYKVKLNENNKFPEGFNPVQTDEDDDETYEGEVLVAYEAPMEGWDTEHMDTIVIVKREDGFYVDGYISFGEFETQGPFDSLEKAEEVAYDVMEELVDGFKDNDEY